MPLEICRDNSLERLGRANLLLVTYQINVTRPKKISSQVSVDIVGQCRVTSSTDLATGRPKGRRMHKLYWFQHMDHTCKELMNYADI